MVGCGGKDEEEEKEVKTAGSDEEEEDNPEDILFGAKFETNKKGEDKKQEKNDSDSDMLSNADIQIDVNDEAGGEEEDEDGGGKEEQELQERAIDLQNLINWAVMADDKEVEKGIRDDKLKILNAKMEEVFNDI